MDAAATWYVDDLSTTPDKLSVIILAIIDDESKPPSNGGGNSDNMTISR